jgi:hypothetical protein
MAGYDTASFIQDVYQAARSEFGEAPAYWIRYFSPSPNGTFNSDPVTESEAAWSSGGHFIGPVSSPTQSRLSGSTAQGQADGQTYAAALLSAYYAVGPLLLPSNQVVYTWLDQEASTSLSLTYWNGWATYIGEYNFAGLGTYPLYPSLYCDPDAAPPNCSIIDNKNAFGALGVWSSEPEPCGTLKNPPAFNPEECSLTPTELWQFGEKGVCGYSANVDLDLAKNTYANYCFNVSSNP